MTYRELRDEMIATTEDSSLADRLQKNCIVTKVGYDELGIKLLKNVMRTLEAAHLR